MSDPGPDAELRWVDVPIEIDVSQTDLAPLAESLADGLRQLQMILDGVQVS